ncbi:hypothetical protein [Kitasatospora kifunensis]|uniref:Uncharacterized protein n=1 Tax=Kitasatospora kifunensis TaxID=58351 RepID=A0A7W7R270_KITKI|nr:hypothetical protein [Kitasatospora kifunensis]MBB4923828.1 hypothetical protein [Kitasatospora kifunensis]
MFVVYRSEGSDDVTGAGAPCEACVFAHQYTEVHQGAFVLRRYGPLAPRIQLITAQTRQNGNVVRFGIRPVGSQLLVVHVVVQVPDLPSRVGPLFSAVPFCWSYRATRIRTRWTYRNARSKPAWQYGSVTNWLSDVPI